MLPPAAGTLRSSRPLPLAGRVDARRLVVGALNSLVEPLQVGEVGGEQALDDAGVDVGQRARAA